jgi:tetratricopeptide (TPR) repeat protein
MGCEVTMGQRPSFKPIRSSVGQRYPMPLFDMNRANDLPYLADRVTTAHRLLQNAKQEPTSLKRDSTILRLYNYLGALYRETKGHKDSSLFYGKLMVEYAHERKNVEFEVKGLFQQSLYYRNIKLNTEEALRLNLKAYKIIENADHDPQVFWRICYNLGDLYISVKEYDNALNYYQQAEVLIKEGTGLSATSTEAYITSIWQGMAIIYTKKKQYVLAENYFLKAIEKLKSISIKASHANIYDDYSTYLQSQERYNEAIEYSKKAEAIWVELNKQENLSTSRSNLALYYLAINDLDKAYQYASQAVQSPLPSLNAIQSGQQALYEIESKRGNWKASLVHYEKYIAIRDSLETKFNAEALYKIQSRFDLERVELKNKQAKDLQEKEVLTMRQQTEFDKLKTATEKQRLWDQVTSEKLKRQIEIQTLREQATKDRIRTYEDKSKQDELINSLKIKELEQEKALENRSRNVLGIGLVFATLLGFVLLWYNRKLKANNRELKAKNQIIKEVTQRVHSTEIAALRAQMNPHFIFNCLNSIQYFAAKNDSESASNYLSKFSKLIRLVLENSRSEKVTLQNELETLRLYIEMEAMRFQNKLSYQLNVASNIELDYIQIPPLLLQPFVENAIWHGLMHKEEGGTIAVDVVQKNSILLQVIVTDNGIGRQKAAEFKSKTATKNKSFGMKVTAERIELINQLYKTATEVKIIDLKNVNGEAAGTKVIIEIPI